MNLYNIYIVNKSTDSQTFWSFLDKPEVTTNETIYANSSSYLTVAPNRSSQSNYFSIPVQFKVGVGASNQAVKLKTRVTSSELLDTNLNQGWQATYYDPTKHQGPILSQEGTSGPKTITVMTNQYAQDQEGPNTWYSNISFGMQTQSGFMGVTWKPNPLKTYTITPKVGFYIATGSYTSNHLADISDISSVSAHVTQASFDDALDCTVTYNSDGTWSIAAGKPSNAAADLLLEAHAALASAHEVLVRKLVGDNKPMSLAMPSVIMEEVETAKPVERTSKGIKFDDGAYEPDPATNPRITGTITVGRVVAAGALYILAAGVRLRITRRHPNGLEFDFEYDGQRSRQALRDLFGVNAIVRFFFGNPDEVIILE